MDVYIHQLLVRMENDGASFNYGICYPSSCQNGNGAYTILDFLDFLMYMVVLVYMVVMHVYMFSLHFSAFVRATSTKATCTPQQHRPGLGYITSMLK